METVHTNLLEKYLITTYAIWLFYKKLKLTQQTKDAESYDLLISIVLDVLPQS